MTRLVFATVLLARAAAAADPGAGEKVSLKDWSDGPIHYIALKQEIEQFDALASDGDRALFIERFWSKRDPTPATLTNEYRQLFWERVQQANAQFLDSTKPGWMTDRGKIFLLYGPPSQVKEEPDLTLDPRSPGRGILRWTYEGRPGERQDLNPVVVVPFVRDAGGEWHVSYEPRLASVFFDATAIREQRYRAIDHFLEMAGAPLKSKLAVMLDLGKLQEVPPQEQVLLERVETIESYKTHPLGVRLLRYLHPEEHETIVVVTVDVSDGAPGTTPAILARFAPLDATQPPRLLGEDSFRVIEVGGKRLAQGRRTLPPGDYTLTLMSVDPSTASTGIDRRTIRVPERSDAPRMSDLTLAADLESLPYASLASYDEPFHVGPFRVVPRLTSELTQGDAVRVFFEIYDATPPFQVSYQVEGQDTDGRWVPLGKPATAEQSETAQAWELVTGPRWPLGDYRVRVEVVDRAGRRLSDSVPFRLLAAAAR
ncbi:MAG TPA: GWxTD domain-containing protein [Candidatus Polarisedimenticolaceae bacterium]|nr:GWxTD domain-containing protein [Candidatus Polarisedimenticolaceae bacterium]